MRIPFDSFETKTHFSQLIDRVERGKEIVITRRGKPVARLVSMDTGHDRAAARATADKLRTLAREMQFGDVGWTLWKQYRDEGRR